MTCIYVDDRAGSVDLAPYLRQRGLSVTVTRLGYGDINFIGNGPDDSPVSIGVEVKTVRDVISCMTDGRFSGHQLPGMIQSYDQSWLVIQGRWRPSPKSGILEYQRHQGQWCEATVGQRRFMWKDLETWLLTVQIKTGLGLYRCSDWSEGIQWISTLYHWWTQKSYEEHRGHLSVHSANSPLFDRALLVRPTLCRMVAMQLPGIGAEKSLLVADHFGSVDNMVCADISDWMGIPGVGRVMAERIYNQLRSANAR